MTFHSVLPSDYVCFSNQGRNYKGYSENKLEDCRQYLSFILPKTEMSFKWLLNRCAWAITANNPAKNRSSN